MKSATKKLILTKSGKVSRNITNQLRNCRFDSKQNKIYTGYYSGSGRNTSKHSAWTTVDAILRAQGYKSKTGNDAPRGGVTGDFIKVSKVAFDFLIDLSKK